MIVSFKPVSKLNKPTLLAHRYFYMDQFPIRAECLSQMFIRDIRIQIANKNLENKFSVKTSSNKTWMKLIRKMYPQLCYLDHCHSEFPEYSGMKLRLRKRTRIKQQRSKKRISDKQKR